MVSTCSIPKPNQDSLKKAHAAAKKLRKLADELAQIFPEREDLINQIVYAIMTREHVLIYGPFGTGKSDLIRTMFDAITGSTQFSIGMNKFMKESDIIGLPNPKVMREEGKVVYDIEGGILEAHFVEFDEFLDANAPVTRSMLNILNERQFKRGRQLERAMLHSAVASTNWSPAQAIAKDGGLEAVLDRFIYHCEVGYLEGTDSRLAMYHKYLAGAKPTTTISYAELEALSALVVGPCQITNPLIVEAFDKLISTFKAEHQDIKVSDRRACKLMKCMEASALLNGRYEVDLEDLYEIRHGLCLGGNKEQHESFMNIAEEVIDEYRALATNPDEVLLKLLDQYESSMPVVPQSPTDEELAQALRAVKALRKQVADVATTVESAHRRRQAILDTIDELEDEINDHLEA